MTIKEQVKKELDNGLNSSQIFEKFKDYNPITIKTYISSCKNSGKKKNINDGDVIGSKEKVVFLDLEKGVSEEEICKKNGFSSKTLDAHYKYKYRKAFNLKSERNLTFSTLSYAHDFFGIRKDETKQVEVSKFDAIKKDKPVISSPNKELCETLFIGSKNYDINVYSIDDIVWFNMDQLFSALRKEEIDFNIKNINLPQKYIINNMIINGTSVNIIDKNILLNLANQIGDHTFINSVLKLMVTNRNIFYKINQITEALEIIDDLVKQYNEVGTSQIEIFETMEVDILHKIENNNKISDEELLQESKKLRNVRLKRREFKNVYVLGGKVKYMIANNKSHSAALRTIVDKLQPISNDLYRKIYNNRSELTEEEQNRLLSE